MKLKLVPLLAAACLIGLVLVSALRAQIGVGTQPEWQEVQLLPGDEMLVHLSYDSAIEIIVDRPFTEKEKVLLADESGKKFPLPNGSAVRAQGHLQVSRAPNPADGVATRVRWRHVDTMFSFSRGMYPKPVLR
jgi:hypothetical protein